MLTWDSPCVGIICIDIVGNAIINPAAIVSDWDSDEEEELFTIRSRRQSDKTTQN